jgi:hypothetical protein
MPDERGKKSENKEVGSGNAAFDKLRRALVGGEADFIGTNQPVLYSTMNYELSAMN